MCLSLIVIFCEVFVMFLEMWFIVEFGRVFFWRWNIVGVRSFVFVNLG